VQLLDALHDPGEQVLAFDLLEAGELEVIDDTMRLPLAVAPATPGHYLVSYNVTSADGHPIGGELHFLVADSSGAVPAPQVVLPRAGGGN